MIVVGNCCFTEIIFICVGVFVQAGICWDRFKWHTVCNPDTGGNWQSTDGNGMRDGRFYATRIGEDLQVVHKTTMKPQNNAFYVVHSCTIN